MGGPRLGRIFEHPVWVEFRKLPAANLFLVFVAIALTARVVFWFYTGRTWEDAVISLTPARNLWDGLGFTHHPSEPNVHSFTSALGELILIAGESVRAGLATMRLASLAASALALYYAFRIGAILRFHWTGQLLVLAYLATDHLQIFFGMSGMETQVATALILANVYYYLTSQWTKLGIAGGLAAICRPEFLLWGVIVGAAVTIWRRREFFRVGLPAVLVSGAWFGFAWLYFGSPIPHTIAVKSKTSPSFSWDRVQHYFAGSWEHVAPFLQYWGANKAPLPMFALQSIVALVMVLFALGAVQAVRTNRRMLAPLALLLGFIAYRTLATVNPYFMWCLPPFAALLFLFAGAGASWLARKNKYAGAIPAILIAVCYSLHLPLSMPLDREMQVKIEEGVRIKVGKRLNALMGPDDAVFLEPLGFIGWEIRPKTTYDFPGLSSPAAFAAYAKHHHMAGVISELNPRFLVQRPPERREFEERMPDLAAQYEAVETFEVGPGLNLRRGGLVYNAIDTKFTIYRRRE